jgi:TRAP-type uncharacterized transport system substrate-binding protein
MKKIFLALVLSLFAQAASAFTIATGPSDGSYFQIAQDIKNVAAKEDIDIDSAEEPVNLICHRR